MLATSFYNRPPLTVAKELLGKVMRVKSQGLWLSVLIIETEAYELAEKGSHSSLGFTEKRKALFMPAGTIYMYYARGKDSFNVSCQGEGNAVLFKSGIPYEGVLEYDRMIEHMQSLNPVQNTGQIRHPKKLCSGQTLLCQSLNLKVPAWDKKTFHPDQFLIEDVGYCPAKVIQTTRLGIPKGRDEHLLYRFIDYDYVQHCTSNPLTKRVVPEYQIVDTF